MAGNRLERNKDNTDYVPHITRSKKSQTDIATTSLKRPRAESVKKKKPKHKQFFYLAIHSGESCKSLYQGENTSNTG